MSGMHVMLASVNLYFIEVMLTVESGQIHVFPIHVYLQNIFTAGLNEIDRLYKVTMELRAQTSTNHLADPNFPQIGNRLTNKMIKT